MISYISTRGNSPAVSSAQAILKGLADDGGLYVPDAWPTLDLTLADLKSLSYQEIAVKVFTAFLPDFAEEDLHEAIRKAYGSQWQNEQIVPLADFGHLHYLELFHGPTMAFKDVALQALPQLVKLAAKKEGLDKEIAILTATSGDTGTAAMAGFADVPKTKIAVLYPKKGISDIQRQQMQSEPGKNTYVYGLEGNFDQAQRAVKELLSDAGFHDFLEKEQIQLSSANSINIGRLIPQIVYYFAGYGQLIAKGDIAPGEAIDIVVPTGNFGNMLAAYYASQVGLPVHHFTVASNENNVLTDFFNQGVYDRRRDFKVTNAPAMDILVSSNLERLLYFATNRNSDVVRQLMTDLQEKGQYHLPAESRTALQDFSAGWTSQETVLQTIQETYGKDHYLIDPHTAVAKALYSEGSRHTLLASTASPYKFAQTVLTAFGKEAVAGQAGLVALSEATKTTIPVQMANLYERPIRHRQVITTDQIKATIQAAFKH